MLLYTDQVQAWNYTQSMHYTHPPRSVVMQVSLSSRYDYTEWATPVSMAIAAFTRITAAGVEIDLLGEFGIVSNFRVGDLTEVHGFLIAQNCYAEAIVNQFQLQF